MYKRMANEIYDICVEECGAPEHLREEFVSYMGTMNNDIKSCFNNYEFRFGGKLGFGGKLHHQFYNKIYVSCYPEDETPERLIMIEKANSAILKYQENMTKNIAKIVGDFLKN